MVAGERGTHLGGLDSALPGEDRNIEDTAARCYEHGQTIFVTEGVGLCQRKGGPVETIRPGDRVFFEPEENHWHGAAPNRFMTHIAMQQNDESGRPVTWGRHVTDEEYGASPTNPD